MKSSPSPALKAIALFVIIWALLSMAVSLPYISMGPEEKAPDLQLKGGDTRQGVSAGSGDLLRMIYILFIGILIALSVIYAIISILKKDTEILKELAAGIIVMLIIGGIIVSAHYLSDSGALGRPSEANSAGGAGTTNITTVKKSPGAVQYSVIAVAIVLAVVLAVKLGISFYSKKTVKVESQGEDLIKKIRAAMRDLESGKEVQDVIIRAYEEMCRTLRKSGVREKKSFTPREFERAIIGQMEIDPEPVSRLTKLFEEAKYSSHPIDDSKRRDAIRALKDLKKEVENYERMEKSGGNRT